MGDFLIPNNLGVFTRCRVWLQSNLLVVCLLATLPWLLFSTMNREETVAFIRARFAQSTQLARLWDTTPEEDRERLANWPGALVPTLKQPTDVLLEAIDLSLQGENIDEQAGALNAYIRVV